MLKLMTILRYTVAGGGALTLFLSFFPRENLGLGGLAVLFFWPFLILQIIIGMLPWHKFVLKHPVPGTILFAIFVWVAVWVMIIVLSLTGYVSK